METRVLTRAVVVAMMASMMGSAAFACLVPIDIMPGTWPNAVCLGDPGLLPVVMFEPDVNALDMADPHSAQLSLDIHGCYDGVLAQSWVWEDVNEDGYADLLFEFAIPELVDAGLLTVETTRLTLCVPGEWGTNWPDSFCEYNLLDGRDDVVVSPGGTIGDLVWNDVDGDGLQDADEPGIPDVIVDLFDDAGEILDSQVTDADGGYLFENVCPGVYTVQVDAATLPPGLTPTASYASPDESIDSNQSPAVVVLTEEEPDDLSIDFGYVAGTECGPCEGKVTELTLEYIGDLADAHVVITQKVQRRGRKGTWKRWNYAVVYDGVVQPGDTFSLVGQDNKGTLGPEIWVTVNGRWHTRIHTSCSQPIGPGAVYGDFEVVAGASRIGGPLCAAQDTGGDDMPRGRGFLWFLIQWLNAFGWGG